MMKVCGANRGGLTTAGMAFLVLLWSQTTQAQVKLEYKFPEHTKLTYKTKSKTRQVLTLMGNEIESEEDSTTVTSRTAGKRRGDSSLPIDEKVESLRVALSYPGGINVNYDSSDPNVKINNPELAFLGDVFKLVSQTAYTVVLDDKNKVKAIEGTEKLLEKTEKLDDKAQEIIKGHFDSQKLKTKFEQVLQVLPDVLARSGEPWERTELLEIGGQTFTFRKKYEYAGSEKKGDKTLDKITSKIIEVAYKQDPDTKSLLKVKKSNLKVESSAGTVLFDREAGRAVSTKGKLHIKGDMTFSVNDMELTGALDLKIDADSELQSPGK
jgi:hypothetical protein